MIPKELFDWYILEINPDPWAIGPVGYARRDGKMSAYVGRNQQLDAYKQAVKEEMAELNPVMLTGKIGLVLFFWRTIDIYQTAQAKSARSHEADNTNLQKATEDALQGILYKNDKDVVFNQTTMVDQSPTAPGRVVVGVSNQVDQFMFADYPFDQLKAIKAERKRTRPELDGQEAFRYDGSSPDVF